jgi:hypothetical protein
LYRLEDRVTREAVRERIQRREERNRINAPPEPPPPAPNLSNQPPDPNAELPVNPPSPVPPTISPEDYRQLIAPLAAIGDRADDIVSNIRSMRDLVQQFYTRAVAAGVTFPSTTDNVNDVIDRVFGGQGGFNDIARHSLLDLGDILMEVVTTAMSFGNGNDGHTDVDAAGTGTIEAVVPAVAENVDQSVTEAVTAPVETIANPSYEGNQEHHPPEEAAGEGGPDPAMLAARNRQWNALRERLADRARRLPPEE